MNLEHYIFLNGIAKASQGFLFHITDCTSVCNGEVGVGNGSDGVGSCDGVIQSEAGYNELIDKALVRTKNSYYKLKNRHGMKSCLWN
jgi:hypothetical protein